MCGIFSAFSTKKNFEKKQIEECLYKIIHRGKDDIGYHYEEKMAIAHNRLSIVGDVGKQPLFNYDKSIIAVVNGEFYDYKKIRNEFIKNGYFFQTETDSEIIIPLYLKYGLTDRFWESLNGEFSFIIIDKNKNKIISGRDRFGIKPFYYMSHKDELYFASEIKAFLPIKNMNWCDESLNSVLTMQYYSDDSTLIDGVKQVPAGNFLIADIKTLNIEEIKPYWDINYSDQDISEEEAIHNIRESLTKSVKRRIESDKKVGITLSGGIDSSIIYSLASQITNKKLDTYSISFKNGGIYDEAIYAKEMSDKYNGNFNLIEVDEMFVLDSMEDAVYHSENVSINNHLSAKYILFKNMKNDGVTVSLSGEGADELFLGYPHFKLDLDNSLENLERNKYLNGIQTPDSDFLDTSEIFKSLGFVPKFLEAKYSMGYKLQKNILNENFVRGMNDPFKNIMKRFNIKHLDDVYKSSYLWSKLCLSNYILSSLGDKMEMASTIEGRVPFLDVDVYNSVKSIPKSLKIKNNVEKYILKEAFKNDITKSIYEKQKHPFVAPPMLKWGERGNNNVFTMVMDILNSSSFKNHLFFDSEKIKKTILNLESNDLHRFDPIIMLILTIHHFEKRFMK